MEGGQLGGDEWTRHGSFVNKPTRGWLHSDSVVSTTGVSYSVRVSDRHTTTKILHYTSLFLLTVFVYLHTYLDLRKVVLCCVQPVQWDSDAGNV